MFSLTGKPILPVLYSVLRRRLCPNESLLIEDSGPPINFLYIQIGDYGARTQYISTFLRAGAATSEVLIPKINSSHVLIYFVYRLNHWRAEESARDDQLSSGQIWPEGSEWSEGTYAIVLAKRPK
jgi:hypothetical protein